MKYTGQILENKTLKILKEVLYNITLAILIMLMGVLVLVYGFKYQLFNVLSDSQAPVFVTNDMVVVKAQNDYEVGDIIQFDHKGTPTAHRLIYIHETGNKKYYICHGDNVQSVKYQKVQNEQYSTWQEESEFAESQLKSGVSISTLQNDTSYTSWQVISLSDINGKVVTHIDNLGGFVQYIKDHYLLLVTLIGAIWCVSYVVQNEQDIKRSLRLF